MNENRVMLMDMVEKLFTDLAVKNKLDSCSDNIFDKDWKALQDLGLPRLMLAEEEGGFAGNWEDTGPVLKALGAHGLALPLGENILVQHWLHRLDQTCPKGMVQFAFAPSDATNDLVLRNVRWGAQTQWIMVFESDRWSLRPTEILPDQSNRGNTSNQHATLRCSRDLAIADGPLALSQESYFAEAALMRACQIAGAVEAMSRMTINHAQERSQFGRPLGRFQAIQHQLSVLAEENAAVSCAVDSACQAAVAGEAGFEMAAAKYRANRAATIAADIAHQIHGAIGFTREFSLHRFSQTAQAWAREYGNEEYWAQWLGHFALAARPEPLWHWITARSDRVIAAEQGHPA
ncbi:acyl-CoA dehydrogenase family protein [Parasphingorhabdus sp.]|uniref:acyl-CoA dehydrogenase family protein n=1 Tax=Parasphingorhabdus sp. TaxID=2709688 RepID=UPI003A9504B7